MAKKLRFTNMNQDILAAINETLETRFVRVMACADIRRGIKKLTADIDVESKKLDSLNKADKDYKANSEAIDARIGELQLEVQKLRNRRDGIMAYTTPLLYGDKEHEGGFRKVLKARGEDFYEYYVDALDRKSINDTKNEAGFKTAMRAMIEDTFGLTAPKAIMDKFCTWMVQTSLYYKPATASKLVKGELVTGVSRRQYNEVLFNNLVQYMNEKGGVQVIVPDKEHYDYIVEYDEGCHPTTFKMVKRDA